MCKGKNIDEEFCDGSEKKCQAGDGACSCNMGTFFCATQSNPCEDTYTQTVIPSNHPSGSPSSLPSNNPSPTSTTSTTDPPFTNSGPNSLFELALSFASASDQSDQSSRSMSVDSEIQSSDFLYDRIIDVVSLLEKSKIGAPFCFGDCSDDGRQNLGIGRALLGCHVFTSVT